MTAGPAPGKEGQLDFQFPVEKTRIWIKVWLTFVYRERGIIKMETEEKGDAKRREINVVVVASTEWDYG